MDHSGARATGLRARVLEERQVGARPRVLVSVKQVVDGRVVLVDRLGGQPQAEDPRVEVDVAAGVAGDRGDVVDAFEFHDAAFLRAAAGRYQIVVYTTIAARFHADCVQRTTRSRADPARRAFRGGWDAKRPTY